MVIDDVKTIVITFLFIILSRRFSYVSIFI